MEKEIKAFTAEEMKDLVVNAGLPAFRAEQMLVWIYGKQVASYEDMTNLPKVVREQFKETYPLYGVTIPVKRESVDGSRKYLVEYHDGIRVETVGLPSKDGRLTVCCSSQAGCAMGCAFCATGKNGMKRNLLPGEIMDQVLAVQGDFGRRVTNIVVMGQGEPFANYDAVIGAMRLANHSKLLNIGARHITVSTCGVIEGIERFAEELEQFTLAVSLHAARQETRDALMPAMKNQKLGALRQALDTYAKKTGRRFSFEYALMKDANDSEEDLRALIAYCRRILCHVNIIPLNDIEGSPFKPSEKKVNNHWLEELEKAGIPASLRESRGSDISGACGQLAAS